MTWAWLECLDLNLFWMTSDMTWMSCDLDAWRLDMDASYLKWFETQLEWPDLGSASIDFRFGMRPDLTWNLIWISLELMDDLRLRSNNLRCDLLWAPETQWLDTQLACPKIQIDWHLTWSGQSERLDSSSPSVTSDLIWTCREWLETWLVLRDVRFDLRLDFKVFKTVPHHSASLWLKMVLVHLQIVGYC